MHVHMGGERIRTHHDADEQASKVIIENETPVADLHLCHNVLHPHLGGFRWRSLSIETHALRSGRAWAHSRSSSSSSTQREHGFPRTAARRAISTTKKKMYAAPHMYESMLNSESTYTYPTAPRRIRSCATAGGKWRGVRLGATSLTRPRSELAGVSKQARGCGRLRAQQGRRERLRWERPAPGKPMFSETERRLRRA